MSKASYPSLFEQGTLSTGAKPKMLDYFTEKSYVECFFEKNIEYAKQLLQSENLPFTDIRIDFSTDSFSYNVSVSIGSVQQFYNTDSTYVYVPENANLKRAIEIVCEKMKSIKVSNNIQRTTSEPEPKATQPEPEPEPETAPPTLPTQKTILDAIADVEILTTEPEPELTNEPEPKQRKSNPKK